MEFNKKKYVHNLIYSAILSLSITLSFSAFSFLLLINRTTVSLASDLLSGCCALLILSFFFLVFSRKYRRRKKIARRTFPENWERILLDKVQFYQSLSHENRIRFQQQVMIFLSEKHIYGIETEIDDVCRILIAASAIIPVFGYPDWEYDFLHEILVYPHNFDDNYQYMNKSDMNILGLVTPVASTMILSKPALYKGFSNTHDNQNVGIHEFVHAIDGNDGHIDGIPALLIGRNDIQEWQRIMAIESAKIENGNSDINPYALKNHADFFSVTSEYFFKNPEIMSERHPELYSLLKKIFRQDTQSGFIGTLKDMLFPFNKKISGNNPCPCGSGKKYKHCCRRKIK